MACESSFQEGIPYLFKELKLTLKKANGEFSLAIETGARKDQVCLTEKIVKLSAEGAGANLSLVINKVVSFFSNAHFFELTLENTDLTITAARVGIGISDVRDNFRTPKVKIDWNLQDFPVTVGHFNHNGTEVLVVAFESGAKINVTQ